MDSSLQITYNFLISLIESHVKFLLYLLKIQLNDFTIIVMLVTIKIIVT